MQASVIMCIDFLDRHSNGTFPCYLSKFLIQVNEVVDNCPDEFFDPLRGTSTDSVGAVGDSDSIVCNSSMKVNSELSQDSSREWTLFKKFLMQRFPVSKLISISAVSMPSGCCT